MSQFLSSLRHFLGDAVAALLDDPSVSEIYCNDDLVLRSDGREGRRALGIQLELRNLQGLFRMLASRADTPLGEEHPIRDFALPPELGGGRLHVVLPPVSREVSFSLRKKANRLLLLPELLAHGALCETAYQRLVEASQASTSVLVVGPTNSGKTNLLMALLHQRVSHRPGDRYVILEDTPEISCPASDVLFQRTTDRVSLWDLVRATLRSSPDYVVVGEVRGREAYPLLDMLSTGHPGAATVHSHGCLAGLRRLDRLARLDLGERAPSQAELIAEVFGTVVTLRYQNGRRTVSELVTVHGWNPEQGFLLESHLPAPQAGPNQGDES